VNAYDNSTSSNNNNSSATDPSGMSQMDPAWLAYYQSMNYYNMMQTGAATPATTATKATDLTATSKTAAGLDIYSLNSIFILRIFIEVNSATGQTDYSQQWIEYYRSVGQNEFADEITRQMKEVIINLL
jgi:hypothetical protein